MASLGGWRNGWSFAVLLFVAAAQVGFFGTDGNVSKGIWLVAFSLCPVAALVLGTRARRPDFTLPWHVLACSQFLKTLGWGHWYVYPELSGVTLGSPSLGDAFFLAGYVGDALALILLSRAHGADRRSFLDVGVLATAIGIVMGSRSPTATHTPTA